MRELLFENRKVYFSATATDRYWKQRHPAPNTKTQNRLTHITIPLSSRPLATPNQPPRRHH